MSTAALEITTSAPAAQPDSIGEGTDNAPPMPTNSYSFVHGDAADVVSLAPPAQPKSASRDAKTNRAQVPL